MKPHRKEEEGGGLHRNRGDVGEHLRGCPSASRGRGQETLFQRTHMRRPRVEQQRDETILLQEFSATGAELSGRFGVLDYLNPANKSTCGR